MPKRLLEARDTATSAAVGAALFALYLFTLCPTVPAGDSGELIAAAATLGIAHPPGYPLFTLLAKLATTIELGTVAARVNALSALCQALAGSGLVLAVRLFGERLSAGAAAGLAFGVATRVWRYATVAEVFALNDLFAAVLLALAAALWVRTEDAVESGDPRRLGDGRLLAALAVTFGMALANHHTIGLVLGPALVAFLALRERHVRARLGVRSIDGRRLVVGVGLFALGLVPYLYVPIASSRRPLLDWDDPTSLSGFVTLLLRRDYGTLGLGLDSAAGAIGPLAHLGRAALAVADDLTIGGAVLAIVGGVALARRRDGKAAFALFAGAFAGIVAFFLLVRTPAQPIFLGIVERFYLLPMVVVAAAGGVGLAALLDRAPRALGPAASAAVISCTVGIAAARFHRVDESHNRFTRVYASNLLASMEPRTLLLSSGDLPYNGLTYATLVERERPDVRVLDQRLLGYDWYVATRRDRHSDVEIPFAKLTGRPGENLLALVNANAPNRPVAFYGPIEESWRQRWVTWPRGLVERVYPANAAPTLEEAEAAHDAVMATLDLSILRGEFDDTRFESLGVSDHTYGDRVYAERWIDRARSATDATARRAALDRAKKRLSIALERAPADVDVLTSLAHLALEPEVDDRPLAARCLARLREVAKPGSPERAWAEMMLPSR
jgi:dolichyl-phosphate-mannose-protein mannosyltransferase